MAGVDVQFQRLLHMWRQVLLQVTFAVVEVEILTIWQHAETTLTIFSLSRIQRTQNALSPAQLNTSHLGAA